MAEFVVSTVATKLSQMVTEELILLHGVSDEVEWMERELRWIKGFIKDASARGKKDERAKNWVIDVAELAYRAEAAIDSFLIKVRHRNGGPSFINSFKPKAWIARHHVGVEISKIKERLNEIKAARETYGIQNLSADVQEKSEAGPERRRRFSPQSDDADIVGLVNDQKILLERLIMNHHQQQQQQQGSCVISIVGIGGLGKTTLARKLYRSNAVINHFHKCIWLTVSQENNVMGLLRKMLEEVRVIEKEKLEKMTENDLIDMINDSLRTERFLIVLDDIWQEDVCIHMQGIFRNVNNGSRILITTRFHNVAKRADPRSTPYQLQLLNDDESMKLLLKKAILYEEDAAANCCSSELLDIGRRLMRKCGGLPLALVVLGGILSVKDKTPVEWRRVLETMDWEAEGRACQEILALSYEDLPHHMKLCFLYLSAYPEDCEIYGIELIRKWIAEGFIPQHGRKAMEDTAEAILEELIDRSLIHVHKRKSDGSVKSCGVHDLLLDFARYTAKENRFLTVCSTQNGQPISSTLSHRLAIHNIDDIFSHETNIGYDPLRTLMAFGRNRFSLYGHPIGSAMYRFQFLRVLDLSRAGFLPKLRKEIKHMIHLRYLSLFGIFNRISGLPSSIGDLRLLETIRIKHEAHVPITLWKIKTLRHVLLQGCTPPQSLKLEDLLTLDSVTFGSLKTINWSLPKLRKLKVLNFEDRHKAMLTNLLSKLSNLISLQINAQRGSAIEINTTKDFPFEDRLRSLTLDGPWPIGDCISEFPIYLTKVELRESALSQDPMPKLERLQYLVTLKFYGLVYSGETIVCLAGGFPRLESLFISGWFHDKIKGSIKSTHTPMPNLQEWSIERGAMPKLTFLRLTSCNNLKMLPDFQHLTRLQRLELYDMSIKLMSRSRKEDSHKIQHVPKLSRFILSSPPDRLGTWEDMDECQFSDDAGGEEEEEEEDEDEARRIMRQFFRRFQ